MTGAEARAMDPEKLAAELADLRRRLYTLQSQTVTEKVEDNTQFGKIKRDIARILTIQREGRDQAEPGRKRRVKPEAATPAKAPAKKPAAKASTKAGSKSGTKAGTTTGTKSGTKAGTKAGTKSKPRGRAKARAASR